MASAGPGPARHRLPTSRWRAATGVIGLVVATAACGADDSASRAGGAAGTSPAAASAAPGGVTVTINTFNFQPDPLTVAAGTVITFVNEDVIDHTVTAGTRDDPHLEVFDGVLAQKDATFRLTFDEPGTYDYFCRNHAGPGMTATIVVE